MHETKFSAYTVALTFYGTLTKSGFVIQHRPQRALDANVIFAGKNLLKKRISCPITLHFDELGI